MEQSSPDWPDPLESREGTSKPNVGFSRFRIMKIGTKYESFLSEYFVSIFL